MMNPFNRHDLRLYAEQVALDDLANNHGTPCYVYSRAALEANFCAYQSALKDCPHLVCYAVKANSNLAVLQVLAQLGAGFDIVSVGELERVIAAGGDPAKTVFSGVAKTAEEMRRALELGIHCFNIESAAELQVLNAVAGEMGVLAPMSLRVNPDVDAGTHPYISTGLRENKFGVSMDEALRVYREASAMDHVQVLGMDCHIGSQLTDLSPFIDALRRLLTLVDTLANEGITLRHLDLGGGLGVRYHEETPPQVADYIAALRAEIAGRELRLIFEPGRSIAANAGILLTRVQYLKPTEAANFAVVDAGMNDMLRPALYQAWLNIVPVHDRPNVATQDWDIVGPVCETADFLGKQRPLALAEGDLLAIMGAGAYGFTMSSNYNSRGRAPELMVDGNTTHVVRTRESITDLMRGEQCLPEAPHG